jgi:hypothetical protein
MYQIMARMTDNGNVGIIIRAPGITSGDYMVKIYGSRTIISTYLAFIFLELGLMRLTALHMGLYHLSSNF